MNKQLLLASSLLLAAIPAQAEDKTAPLTLEGGLTAIFQSASDDRVKDEGSASMDLEFALKKGPGAVHMAVEASTTPRAAGVSGLIPEANGDSGSAVDGNGEGRFQVSQLYYEMPFIGGQLRGGLVDLPAWLDTSDIANDETTQFLNTDLKNNPTIEFPDYTLGLVLERGGAGAIPGFVVTVASSHGLGDNPNAAYSELFDVNDTGKGVFAVGELNWVIAHNVLRVGLWQSSADHANYDGVTLDDDASGIYLVLDSRTPWFNMNVRAGQADQEVMAAAQFVSLAFDRSFGKFHVGAGVARTGLSEDAPAGGDRTSAELYGRYTVMDGLDVSASVQNIKNSQFDDTGTTVDESVNVFGLRVQYGFSG